MPFYAKSMVTMSDGSKKPIEQISYGDYVKDFQGNPVMVDGVRIRSNFIQNPVREKFIINQKMLVTDCTMFFSPEYNFYVTGTNPLERSNTFTLDITCSNWIGEKNRIRDLFSWLDASYKSKFHLMDKDVFLLTENGSEKVTSLIQVTDSQIDPSLDVIYNISTTNGTLWVDGYLVVCRLNEKFDYLTMTPITDTISIIFDTNIRKYLRVASLDYSINEFAVWDQNNDCWLNAWMLK